MEAIAIKEIPIILDQVPFNLDMDFYLGMLRLGERTKYIEKAKSFAQEALEIGRPKAFFRPAYIEKKDGRVIIIDGITFNSDILGINLRDVYRVFPFVATSGTELEEWSKTKSSTLEQFWADVLKQEALKAATEAVTDFINKNFGIEKIGQMNPGSLADWPLTEQIPLFQLLEKVEESIGVVLTEGLAMFPIKSVSGLLFPSESEFKNCQLCKRQNCPGRRSPYNAGFFQQM